MRMRRLYKFFIKVNSTIRKKLDNYAARCQQPFQLCETGAPMAFETMTCARVPLSARRLPVWWYFRRRNASRPEFG